MRGTIKQVVGPRLHLSIIIRRCAWYPLSFPFQICGAALGTCTTGLAICRESGMVKPVVVLLVFLGAPLGFSLSNLETPVWQTEIYTFLMAAGFGSVLTMILIALLAQNAKR